MAKQKTPRILLERMKVYRRVPSKYMHKDCSPNYTSLSRVSL